MKSYPHVPAATPARNRSLRLLSLTTLAALGAAFAQMVSAAPHDGMGHADMGERGGHAAMMEGGGMGMHGGPHRMERMLDAVKATPEQRAQIKQISEAARTDMAALRESGRKLHEQERALFAQPNVDARAAETLRQQKLAHHDQASKRMLQMKLEISRVLSPEQRAQLGDRMQKRMDMMQRHHQERQGLEKPRT